MFVSFGFSFFFARIYIYIILSRKNVDNIRDVDSINFENQHRQHFVCFYL